MNNLNKEFHSLFYNKLMKARIYLIALYTTCSHHCRMCTAAQYNGIDANKSLSKVRKEIVNAKSLGMTDIMISGTEATLHPRLVQIIKLVRKHGLRCCVGTNGRRFATLDFVKSFKDLDSFALKMTFHSHKRELFDYLSGTPGSYLNTLKAMENIISYLEVYPKSITKVLSMHIVMNKLNYKDLPEMVRFLYSRGIRCVSLSSLTLTGRTYENPGLLVDLDTVRPYFIKAISEIERLKMVYMLIKLPICIYESRYKHFLRPYDKNIGVKIDKCKVCKFNKKCWGFTKVHFVAKYKKDSLKFPFLNQPDVEFVNSL
jgi:MoaA/NifB/PqqE/SkfB family radical SAM enzyme